MEIPSLTEDGHRIVRDASDTSNAQAVIHTCSRGDSGKYTCKIKNEAGEIEVPITVQVVGKIGHQKYCP